jgi:hypothetical protein
MPSISVAVAHTLGQEEASSRLKHGFGSIRQTYEQHVSDLEEAWDGHVLTYSFKTFGFTIKGTVAVEPSEVKLHSSLPLAAVMFKGTIEQQIRDQMTKLLA